MDTGGCNSRAWPSASMCLRIGPVRGWAGGADNTFTAWYATPRRDMYSDTARKPTFGTFKCMRSPSRSGAGKRKEAHCFTASNYLRRVRAG